MQHHLHLAVLNPQLLPLHYSYQYQINNQFMEQMQRIIFQFLSSLHEKATLAQFSNKIASHHFM